MISHFCTSGVNPIRGTSLIKKYLKKLVLSNINPYLAYTKTRTYRKSKMISMGETPSLYTLLRQGMRNQFGNHTRVEKSMKQRWKMKMKSREIKTSRTSGHRTIRTAI